MNQKTYNLLSLNHWFQDAGSYRFQNWTTKYVSSYCFRDQNKNSIFHCEFSSPAYWSRSFTRQAWWSRSLTRQCFCRQRPGTYNVLLSATRTRRSTHQITDRFRASSRGIMILQTIQHLNGSRINTTECRHQASLGITHIPVITVNSLTQLAVLVDRKHNALK